MGTKVAFILLQYMAWQDTIECVESINKHIDTDDYMIIIVDNCSPGDSYKQVVEYTKSHQHIIALQTEKNVGFAKGNNVGFRYAKQKFNPDYIVMCNNDVIFYKNDILYVLSKKYNEYDYDVLGPMIITKDGKYTSNPISFNPTFANESEIKREIRINKLKVVLCKAHLFGLIKRLGFRTSTKVENYNKALYLTDHLNVRLHGSFLAFSRNYIAKYDGIDEATFMYGEELFLQRTVLLGKGKLLYTPDYSVFHKEDASTDQRIKKENSKALFIYTNNIESQIKYLDSFKAGEKSNSSLGEK